MNDDRVKLYCIQNHTDKLVLAWVWAEPIDEESGYRVYQTLATHPAFGQRGARWVEDSEYGTDPERLVKEYRSYQYDHMNRGLEIIGEARKNIKLLDDIQEQP